jgi:Domain of unknown function (DUF4184)
MPVTFPAHQAIVLPLKLRWPGLDGMALCIGSAAPDLGYVFQGTRLEFLESHYRWWVLPWGVFITFALAAWLRWLFARADVWAPAHSADVLQKSFSQPPAPLTIKRIGNRVACACIGIASHVGWDSLTHGSSPLMKYLPALHPRSTLANITMYRFAWLQWLGHTVGSAIAIFLLWRLWQQSRTNLKITASTSDQRASAKLIQVGVSIIAGVAIYVVSNHFVPRELSVAIIRGFWTSLSVFTVIVAIRYRSVSHF